MADTARLDRKDAFFHFFRRIAPTWSEQTLSTLARAAADSPDFHRLVAGLNGKGTAGEVEELDLDDIFPTLARLMEEPGLMDPPEPTISRFVWRGRSTLLAGPDKCGKSTLAGHMVAAITTGDVWLSEPLTIGTAVVVAPDEHPGDTVRRLVELNAAPANVRVLKMRPPNLLASLEKVLDASYTDVVVIDSLAEWARTMMGRAPDDGDNAGWSEVVRPITALAHEKDVGVLLLHHVRRSDGQARGAGEIFAAVDCYMELHRPGKDEDEALRHVRNARGRWHMDPSFSLTLNMEENRWTLGGGGALSPDLRVLSYVRRHPHANFNATSTNLAISRKTLRAVVNNLKAAGELCERTGPRNSKVLCLPEHMPPGIWPDGDDEGGAS